MSRAGLWDAEALSDVAATTFPLACPPEATEEDVDAFVAGVLSSERFGEYLSDPAHSVLKATAGDDIVGYAMLVDAEPADPSIARAVTVRPVAEVSKMYVLPGRHGTGVSTALMHAVAERARTAGAAGLWLGVNQRNERAKRFYAKHGFVRVGTRTFRVGRTLHRDDVMQLTF